MNEITTVLLAGALTIATVPGWGLAVGRESGETGLLELRNERVALRLDARTGAFLDIYNQQTGLHHLAEDDTGSWPLGLELAGPEEGRTVPITIAPGVVHPQTMRHELGTEDDGQTTLLVMRAAGWQDLWREKYFPAFARLGASGVYWDQGPTQYLVCPREDHPHRRQVGEQLSAHVRGVLQLQGSPGMLPQVKQLYSRV